jgi:hypothetical protein
MKVGGSMRQLVWRTSIFAAGAFVTILVADAGSMALVEGAGMRDLQPGSVIHHGEFLLTLAALVVLGGAIGFGTLDARALSNRVIAILGAVAASLAYMAGIASSKFIGVTASILVIVGVAALVVVVAGRFAGRASR